MSLEFGTTFVLGSYDDDDDDDDDVVGVESVIYLLSKKSHHGHEIKERSLSLSFFLSLIP